MGVPFIGDIIDAVGDIFSEVVVDKDKRNEINLELEKIKDAANERYHEEMIAQTEINKVEASHRSLFVAGWRPFIGWTGGVGLAWAYLVGPLLSFTFDRPMPDVNVYELMVLIGGMLGFGVQRSYDKKAGTSNDVLKEAVPAPASPVRKKVLGITLPEKAPWA